MEVEHLATLERLRQSQRQDYLKVSIRVICIYTNIDVFILIVGSLILFFFNYLGFCIWFRSSNRSPYERIT